MPLRLHREHGAALHGVAVDMHRAGAALARIAADVRPGEIQLVAQHVGEERPRLHLGSPRGAVHVEGDGTLHDPGSRSREGWSYAHGQGGWRLPGPWPPTGTLR